MCRSYGACDSCRSDSINNFAPLVLKQRDRWKESGLDRILRAQYSRSRELGNPEYAKRSQRYFEMKNEKFNGYTEHCLSLARSWGWEKEIKAKEQLAWDIHEQFPPVGSLLLGHQLLEQGASYLKRDIGTKEFAKKLVAESFSAVQDLKEKDGWDYFYLGLSHVYGRGTSQDFSLAAAAFLESKCRGNLYAAFEEIWSRYLAGGARLEAILGLTALSGKLADFAAYSGQALALLEIGPCREKGSQGHITRLLLLGRALHRFIYHAHGTRQINIAIEKEFREEVSELQEIKTARSNLALYLMARASRSNPTGKKPIEWFRHAIGPENAELEVLCRCRELGVEELRMIVERAEVEGWKASPLASLASSELEKEDN